MAKITKVICDHCGKEMYSSAYAVDKAIGIAYIYENVSEEPIVKLKDFDICAGCITKLNLAIETTIYNFNPNLLKDAGDGK